MAYHAHQLQPAAAAGPKRADERVERDGGDEVGEKPAADDVAERGVPPVRQKTTPKMSF